MGFFPEWFGFGSLPGSGDVGAENNAAEAEKKAEEAKKAAAEAEKKAEEAKKAAAEADAKVAELKQTPPVDVPKTVVGGRRSKQKFSKKRKGGKKRVRTNKKHR